jgi:hypothetical protein
MTASRKKAPGARAARMAALPPEVAAELASQVARVAGALKAGQAPETLPALVTAKPEDPLWDLHLMAALGALAHEAIPPLLAALFGSSPDKQRRKALKRTLHLLRTRGVAAPADLLPRDRPGPLRPAAVSPCVAFVSPIFGPGERFVILEGPKEILEGNFLVARVSDQAGFRECHLLSLKRKEQAEFWDHFRQQGLEWVSAPPAYGVRLLEEAYTLNPRAEGGASRYEALRERVRRHWRSPEEAPSLESLLPALSPGDRRRCLEQSRGLAQEEVFQAWLPALEEVTPWLKKIQEAQESPLLLTEQQQRDRLEGVVAEATAALYPPESRELWSRRLLAMAYYLDLKGHGAEARAAQAAAEDLRAGTRSPLVGENPFLKGLVWRALQLALEVIKTSQPPEEVSLVARPAAPLIARR